MYCIKHLPNNIRPIKVLSRNLCVSRINEKQCKDKDSSTVEKQCGKSKGAQPKPEENIPAFCRKFKGGGCDQKQREIKSPCTDKAERDSAPEQQCGKGKRTHDEFSSQKQQCCRKRSQAPKAESSCSSNQRSEADVTSFCKQAQDECDQKLHEIKKTLCQAVCETRKIRAIVETNMRSRTSEKNSQGVCTSPPGQSTCKYKKLTTFLNIIGLAFLANIAYCIYKHGEVKEKERRGDDKSDDRT